ncbi:MAG: hypothetical protein IJN81_06995, partial [Clostridia bacterium]|nr:hypothetical protein [Clostridia bacterium]
MINIFTVVLFLIVPALMIFLCVKFKMLNKLGVVLLCYLFGMIVGNIGILPHSFNTPTVTNVTLSITEDIPHSNVTVEILGTDSTVAETVVLNSQNNYIKTVVLPYEDDSGNAITYSVSDSRVDVSSSAGDSVLGLLQSVTICLALPLVLFSLDISKFLKIAKKGMLCMLLAGISVLIVTFVLHLIFRNSVDCSSQLAAGTVSL